MEFGTNLLHAMKRTVGLEVNIYKTMHMEFMLSQAMIKIYLLLNIKQMNVPSLVYMYMS